MVDAVGDKDIPPTVVVHIEHKPRPAPVCGVHPAKIGHLREGAVPVVELQRILDILLVKIFALLEFVDVIPFEFHHGFDPLLGLGQHVGNKDILQTIVVDIPDIDAHGRQAQVPGPVLDLLGEGAVPVVDIEVVPLVEIVGNVDVRVQVLVDVGDHDPQAKADEAAVNTGLLAHVGERVPVVSQEHVANAPENVRHPFPVLGPDFPLFGIAQAAHRDVAVV